MCGKKASHFVYRRPRNVLFMNKTFLTDFWAYKRTLVTAVDHRCWRHRAEKSTRSVFNSNFLGCIKILSNCFGLSILCDSLSIVANLWCCFWLCLHKRILLCWEFTRLCFINRAGPQEGFASVGSQDNLERSSLSMAEDNTPVIVRQQTLLNLVPRASLLPFPLQWKGRRETVILFTEKNSHF